MLECRDCEMKFDNQGQLLNHLSKFCSKSDYGDIKKLQQKLDEANKEGEGPKIDLRNNLTVDEIKQYLRGEEIPQTLDISEMPLGRLRQNIRAVENEFSLATKDQMAKKEQEMRQELNTLTLEKQQIRAKRKQEEAVLEDLLHELELRKQREFKARAEKEQIEMAMKELENRKLTTLENEKKQELKKLHEERESLRLKEEELMNDVQRLQQRIDDNERLWKAERDKANLEARGVDVSINMQNLQKRQMQLAKERGEFAAGLVKKNEVLEQERQRIMDDLRKIKKGDYGSIRKNAAGVLVASKILGNPSMNDMEDRKLPSQAQRMRERMIEDQERLDRLKRQHEEGMGRDTPYIINGNDASRQEFVANLGSSGSNPTFKPTQSYTGGKNRFIEEVESLKNQTSAPYYNPKPPTPKPEPPQPYQNPYAPPYPYQPNPYNPYNPYGQYNPYAPYPQYNPYGPYPQYNPYAPYNPYMYQPPAEDPEAKVLLNKIKKLKKKIKNTENDDFYTSLQEGLKAIQSKFDNPSNKESDPPQRPPQDLLPEERALRNAMQQEQNELKLLAALPKGSELYNVKLEHYKEMTQKRMNMEAMLQEITLDRMKRNLERDMAVEQLKYQNEKRVQPENNVRDVKDVRDVREFNDVRDIKDAPQTPRINRSSGGGSFVPPRSGDSNNPLANNGIAVRIEKLIGFISKSHIRFKVTLLKDEEIAVDRDNNKCQWVSDPVNALGIEANANKSRRIPGTFIQAEKADLNAAEIDSNARQSAGMRSNPNDGHNVIDIHKEILFFNNFYTMLHRLNWTKNIYLIIEVLERTANSFAAADRSGSRQSDQTNFLPAAWSIYQISNSEDRILNFGTIDLNLYEPPIDFPITRQDQLKSKEGTISVTIYEPIGNINIVSPPSRRPGSLSSLRPKSRLVNFIENLTPQIEDARFYEKGDGIDFYIDSARFLPDNTSCTKVLVKAFSSNIDKIGNSVGGLPDLNTSAYSPVFGFRTEFRKPIFDPTTTIVVTILTIDTNHNEERILGYTAINMFLNKMRTDQPNNPNDQDFIVNKGCFQMPIYCQEPYRKPPFGLQSFKKLETIPCATLLVRIREAPKADNGLRVLSIKDVLPSEWYIRGIVVPPPKYEERAYNTSNCMPSNSDRKLYEERLKRPDLSVRDATCQIQNQLGIHLNLKDDELLNWIDQRLQVTPRTPIIDMKYFARYNPAAGFKIAIDAVHNVPTDDPHVVIFCLNPPGALYSSTVITEDVQFTTKVEWNSSIKTPQYLDGFQSYRNLVFDKNLHLIIDIRAVSFAKQRAEVISVGWTLLPIFSNDGYVRSGIYQLPVFKGGVPAQFLPDLATSDPWTLLMNSVGKPGGPVYLDPVSVIVRLVDTQRDGHFIVPLDVNRITYDYIAEDMKPRLAYNAAAQTKSETQRRLKSLVPGNFSPETYLKRVNEAVANVIFI